MDIGGRIVQYSSTNARVHLAPDEENARMRTVLIRYNCCKLFAEWTIRMVDRLQRFVPVQDGDFFC